MNVTMQNANRGGAARRDLLAVVSGALLFFCVSVMFELSEHVRAFTQQWERYQLDEMLGMLLFLAIALSWFGWRRVGEARVELARRVLLEKQLADTLAENRRLSLSHVQVQEDERKQLAREMHDELGQHLNAIKLDAVMVRDLSGNNAAGKLTNIHAASLAIIAGANRVQDTIRGILRRLRPAGLDELGLAAALEHLVQQWQAHNPDTCALLEVDEGVNDLNGDLGENENMTCYRMVQEALTNVARHAHARNVRVSLRRRDGHLAICVIDDGTGMLVAERAPGLGLVGMRERVEALGGRIQIASAPREGFRIEAAIPVAAPAAAPVAM